ncbi:MAG: type VI secretion system-associated protein TagF [Luteibacter sp.]|uniref:type VI secretion system-associated protein TagF n=1 Tax=Luteibacter sp. TaxID=1886636 RepID=UPI002809E93A|nr:type VI secretion system-associated protein TagF [Luteibacter sp.]MDQ7998137.1 type VI secretion system-associated protein TagF [Luteibacter sp.]
MWPLAIDRWRITPPAIWGKLPAHADFVRSGVRHGEVDAWVSWLDAQSHGARMDVRARTGALPVAFVLPPGTLPFARRRFVLGVIAPSIDKVGRHHPLLVYQKARPRWIRRHFEAQLRQPRDWQFWTARAVTRHIDGSAPSNLAALQCTLRSLWRVQTTQQGASGAGVRDALMRQSASPTVLRTASLQGKGSETGSGLHGVRYLPWADWPDRLEGAHAESAFWQQDAQGRFVGAANRLQRLWGDFP